MICQSYNRSTTCKMRVRCKNLNDREMVPFQTKGLKFFSLGGLRQNSKVFFLFDQGMLGEFQFNPEQRNFSIYGAEFHNIHPTVPK